MTVAGKFGLIRGGLLSAVNAEPADAPGRVVFFAMRTLRGRLNFCENFQKYFGEFPKLCIFAVPFGSLSSAGLMTLRFL